MAPQRRGTTHIPAQLACSSSLRSRRGTANEQKPRQLRGKQQPVLRGKLDNIEEQVQDEEQEEEEEGEQDQEEGDGPEDVSEEEEAEWDEGTPKIKLLKRGQHGIQAGAGKKTNPTKTWLRAIMQLFSWIWQRCPSMLIPFLLALGGASLLAAFILYFGINGHLMERICLVPGAGHFLKCDDSAIIGVIDTKFDSLQQLIISGNVDILGNLDVMNEFMMDLYEASDDQTQLLKHIAAKVGAHPPGEHHNIHQAINAFDVGATHMQIYVEQKKIDDVELVKDTKALVRYSDMFKREAAFITTKLFLLSEIFSQDSRLQDASDDTPLDKKFLQDMLDLVHEVDSESLLLLEEIGTLVPILKRLRVNLALLQDAVDSDLEQQSAIWKFLPYSAEKRARREFLKKRSENIQKLRSKALGISMFKDCVEEVITRKHIMLANAANMAMSLDLGLDVSTISFRRVLELLGNS